MIRGKTPSGGKWYCCVKCLYRLAPKDLPKYDVEQIYANPLTRSLKVLGIECFACHNNLF